MGNVIPPPHIPPPGDSFLSKTTTFLPDFARYLAAVIPAGPAPAMATSTSK